MTRGLRNNNPANIRKGSHWLGLSATQTDKEFCQFNSIEYGIRAFFVLMRTYHYKYRCDTISQILHKFAPSSENDTSAYIDFVVKSLNQSKIGLSREFVHLREFFCNDSFEFHFNENTVVNTWFNYKTPSVFLRAFAKAVFIMESNYKVTDEQINKAIELL